MQVGLHTTSVPKIVGMTRARSGRGLSEELCNAGWQLGTAATKLASDLDCRQLGNLLLDLRLLGHWDEIQSLGPELLKRVEITFAKFSAWDLTNVLSGCAAASLLDSATLKMVFRTAMCRLASCDASYWQKWKGKDIANSPMLWAYGGSPLRTW